MVDNEMLQDIAMEIIANGGAAKTEAFKALSLAKAGDYEGCEKSLKEADGYYKLSQSAHHKLLTMDAGGELPQPDILLTHAQDHFMGAMLSLELIREIVELYKKLEGAQ